MDRSCTRARNYFARRPPPVWQGVSKSFACRTNAVTKTSGYQTRVAGAEICGGFVFIYSIMHGLPMNARISHFEIEINSIQFNEFDLDGVSNFAPR
jgi:hypothetical protein